MAMISKVADSGLRRSEVVALRWADIERQADGAGRISVQHSKTDQSGEGAFVTMTELAMDDSNRWREVQSGGDRPFQLTGETVRHRTAKAAKDAGLGEGFSGHSPRADMAVRMVERGAPKNAVMQQGHWRTSAALGRYTKNLKAVRRCVIRVGPHRPPLLEPCEFHPWPIPLPRWRTFQSDKDHPKPAFWRVKEKQTRFALMVSCAQSIGISNGPHLVVVGNKHEPILGVGIGHNRCVGGGSLERTLVRARPD
ncbi:MAG: tyrosine-type recombinase/integrase [Gammaproteobacteria bacterium]|nr:tyrosine-type recombinase/integrase [Gammaproteobacteria bacterium]